MLGYEVQAQLNYRKTERNVILFAIMYSELPALNLNHGKVTLVIIWYNFLFGPVVLIGCAVRHTLDRGPMAVKCLKK